MSTVVEQQELVDLDADIAEAQKWSVELVRSTERDAPLTLARLLWPLVYSVFSERFFFLVAI